MGAARVAPGDSRAVRTIVALLVLASTGLLLYAPLEDDGVTLGVLMTYRASTGMLVVLWGERLVSLGARRAGLRSRFPACCRAQRLRVWRFSQVGWLVRCWACCPCLPEGFLLRIGLGLSKRGEKRCGRDGLRRSLPRFACSSTKDRAVAVGLVTLPLVCRGPMVMSQSSWMGLQGDAAMSSLIQASIGAGSFWRG